MSQRKSAIIPFTRTSHDNSTIASPGAPTTAIFEEIQMITSFLLFGQQLCEQGHNIASSICHGIVTCTYGHAQIHISRQKTFRKNESSSKASLSLPVQFKDVMYGTLYIQQHPSCPEQPAISPPSAQLLALICGWLLHTLEQTIFIQGQYQQLEYQIHGPLTRREHEVLNLMFQGNTQEDIADILHIAPATVGKHRQHIYEQLGVHSERDALLAAFHARIVSLLEEV